MDKQLSVPKVIIMQRSTHDWDMLADWLARHAYRIPVYHFCCTWLWKQALQRSVNPPGEHIHQ